MFKNKNVRAFGARKAYLLLAIAIPVTPFLQVRAGEQPLPWRSYINWRNQVNTALTSLTTMCVTVLFMKYIGITVHHKYDGQNQQEQKKVESYFPDETFASVAGMSSIIDEFSDIVRFLKSPEQYTRFGARPPRGVLLVGAPGNGKTLLAKALAGETHCAFYSVSGSEFVEMWVGLGAARVRDLFDKARKHAPSIIFIDEIDAIGKKRTEAFGGADEFAVTLNQLLTEMDGFSTTDDVIVVAATNRKDILDEALLRPGRFDRHIEVPYPDRAARKEVLELHAKDKHFTGEIDFDVIARRTSGFSCADLANLLNEAAILAARNPWSAGITQADIEEAYDKQNMGPIKDYRRMNEKEKRETAYHEAGHALVQMLHAGLVPPLHKITIVPRGGALGVTYWDDFADERFSSSKEALMAQICIFLAGRAAEEIACGAQNNGAWHDFNQATNIARHMIRSYGMSEELGVAVYSDRDLSLAPEIAVKIERLVQDLLNECMAKTKGLLTENKDKLERLAQELLKEETVDGKKAYEIVGLSYPEN